MAEETAKESGGSGGGGSSPDRVESVKGSYGIKANSLEVLCMPPLPPAIPGPSVITLAATGLAVDGLVNVYGSQGGPGDCGAADAPTCGLRFHQRG
jgi:hypothetical protein